MPVFNYPKSLFIFFAAWFSSFVAVATENIEVIEVKGKRTIPFLEKQIDKTRINFYELLNEVNGVSKFDIICRIEKKYASNIKHRACEPRYIKDTRARLIMERAATGMSIDLRRLPTERDVQMAAKQDKEDSLVHMQQLIINNPELREVYLELQDMVASYEQRKDSKD